MFHKGCGKKLQRVSDRTLQKVAETAKEDPVMTTLMDYVTNGWTSSPHDLPSSLQPYSQYRGNIGMQGDILMYEDRVIIPPAMRAGKA